MSKRIAILLVLFVAFAFVPQYKAQGQIEVVPTFESLGISTTLGKDVNYREVGGDWRKAYDLWFDSRESEYRGSIVGLAPGTEYEIEINGQNTFASTWSEDFPIKETIQIYDGNGFTVNQSGSETGYVLYDGPATLSNCESQCITIPDGIHHVIIRNLTIQGGRFGIRLYGASDIVIENNDISGWSSGYDYDGAIYSKSTELTRVVVQRNKIHDPSHGANNWSSGHPTGPQGIVFWNSSGNHVFRYNEIYSNNGNWYNDGMGAGDNFSQLGFPGANTDIYGNYIAQYWDDAIEAEGGGENVRIWGNYLGEGFCKVGTAQVSIGPMYVFRNVSEGGKRSPNELNSGGFIKTSDGGGRLFLFHNTALDFDGFKLNNGVGWGGVIDNVYSRNNIWNVSATAVYYRSGSVDGDFDNDLYYPRNLPTDIEPNGIKAEPVIGFAGLVDMTGDFSLSPGSPGVGAAVMLPNFSNGLDIGAMQTGDNPMQFGINAYLGNDVVTPVPPTDTPAPPTATPIPPTATPASGCVQVVWDKGTVTQGLNIRPSASMFNAPDGRSYLGPGFVFEPIAKTVTWEGTFYQVTYPSGWVAGNLTWNSDIYAIEVGCP